MEFLCEMIVVLEIIMMNLCIFRKNANSRYPFSVVFIILLIYTMILITAGIYIINLLGIYGNGNGLFTLFGFFYLLPLHYLYEGPTHKHFYIICFAWIYTLSVFIISVQLGSLFTSYLSLPVIVMIIQTGLFFITYYFVNKFMNQVYIALMQCQDEKIQQNLNLTSLLWFICIFLINMHFIFETSKALKIIAFLALIINAFYNFILLYEILMKRDQIGSLQSIVYKDTLTGVGSRLAFDKVMEQKMSEGKPFYFLYMDLDEFKKINDDYGHLMGDQYLQEFSSRIKEIGRPGLTFRISGDEFVMLIFEQDVTHVLDALHRLDFVIPSTNVRFRGVSFGISHYPSDAVLLDDLISFADQQMYKSKMKKKQS